MRPVPALIAYGPDFRGALPRVGVDAVGIEDLSIDYPGTAEVIEPQQSLFNDFGEIHDRQRPQRSGDLAVIGRRRHAHVETHHLIAGYELIAGMAVAGH